MGGSSRTDPYKCGRLTVDLHSKFYRENQKMWEHLPLKKRPVKHYFEDSVMGATFFPCFGSELFDANDAEMCIPLDLSSNASYETISIDDSVETVTNASIQMCSNPSSPTSTISYDSTDIYSCKYCDKEFTSRNRHRAHIRRHLSKDSGRYTCRVCEKTFVQKSSLTTHVRIHSGERPYNCSTCDLKFSDYSTFTKHKRVHSGEKPYRCPVCDRKFSQSGNMHRHMKSIHKGYLNN